MVIINVAYTTPINPSSASPVLTVPQVWAGLQHKIRHPKAFVPTISASEVQSETTEGHGDHAIPVVTREDTFKDGGEKKIEVCRSYEPCMVEFRRPDGTIIGNTVGFGAGGEPGDLYLTFSFSWIRPEVSKGSAEEGRWQARHRDMAQKAAEKTVATIREMVKDGRIQ